MAEAAARLPVTVVVIAFDEAIHIARCLDRLVPFVERVVVVDSFSRDDTVAIARAHGAEVLQHAFTTHAAQVNWAIEAAAATTPWTMRIDADEYFEDGALLALGAMLAAQPADVGGVTLRRKFVFRGRWIRHGRYYPVVLLRCWRTGAAVCEQRFMDEHMVLVSGRTAAFEGGDLVDHNLADVDRWTAKHNRYATLAMADAIAREHGLAGDDDRVAATGGAARRNRALKHGVYGRAPLYLRAVLLYVYRYVFRLGFLDGKVGFLFHTLHGLWLHLLIDAKIDEARETIRRDGLDAFRERLATRHGIRL